MNWIIIIKKKKNDLDYPKKRQLNDCMPYYFLFELSISMDYPLNFE